MLNATVEGGGGGSSFTESPISSNRPYYGLLRCHGQQLRAVEEPNAAAQALQRLIEMRERERDTHTHKQNTNEVEEGWVSARLPACSKEMQIKYNHDYAKKNTM